jgi:glycosyltransferase involved in cell wall biosynthesis
MKVGVITPRYPPNIKGGGEISVQLLAEQLRGRTDHDIVVHSFDAESQETVNGVTVIRHRTLPSTPELASSLTVAELRGKLTDYDILHGYNMRLHPAVGILSELTSTPSVAHLNSYTFVNKRKLQMELSMKKGIYNDYIKVLTRPIINWSISQIDALIALSATVEEIYSNEEFETDIVRVTNMIDPNLTPSTVDFSLGDPAKILYVGNLNQQKGVEYLVRAISLLNSDIHVAIVGDGPELDTLQRIASETGVTDRVNFTGTVPYSEVTDYYADSDVFVHPGVWPEPLNRTVMEAMQHGLAVVSTNRGGPADIISEKALLCEPRNPKALAQTIDYGIEHRQDSGKRQRDYILDRNCPSEVIQQIDELYHRIS